ncbi:hypothetical protein D9M70_357100 [compost metagenome]
MPTVFSVGFKANTGSPGAALAAGSIQAVMPWLLLNFTAAAPARSSSSALAAGNAAAMRSQPASTVKPLGLPSLPRPMVPRSASGKEATSPASMPARFSMAWLAQPVWWSLPLKTTGTSAHSPRLKMCPRPSAWLQ